MAKMNVQDDSVIRMTGFTPSFYKPADQQYDPNSTNAQSGKAVAEALSVIGDINDLLENRLNGGD